MTPSVRWRDRVRARAAHCVEVQLIQTAPTLVLRSGAILAVVVLTGLLVLACAADAWRLFLITGGLLGGWAAAHPASLRRAGRDLGGLVDHLAVLVLRAILRVGPTVLALLVLRHLLAGDVPSLGALIGPTLAALWGVALAMGLSDAFGAALGRRGSGGTDGWRWPRPEPEPTWSALGQGVRWLGRVVHALLAGFIYVVYHLLVLAVLGGHLPLAVLCLAVLLLLLLVDLGDFRLLMHTLELYTGLVLHLAVGFLINAAIFAAAVAGAAALQGEAAWGVTVAVALLRIGFGGALASLYLGFPLYFQQETLRFLLDGCRWYHVPADPPLPDRPDHRLPEAPPELT